jgi:hypothetical protein
MLGGGLRVAPSVTGSPRRDEVLATDLAIHGIPEAVSLLRRAPLELANREFRLAAVSARASRGAEPRVGADAVPPIDEEVDIARARAAVDSVEVAGLYRPGLINDVRERCHEPVHITLAGYDLRLFTVAAYEKAEAPTRQCETHRRGTLAPDRGPLRERGRGVPDAAARFRHFLLSRD